ncbi:conserved hypothetical protein [Vibrio cholerae O1 str. 2010EL-1786]|uniref:Uncharacterized protein n=3 Tax=Vibrio cholerae TaxID=666 RepID=Q9KKU1_VIBCH|nr:hypothetical protein VC_A1009 [Vibrio cholerae O1 biovar El Tor str. N16961]ACP07927.1 conserved hypothetical protein [Vibrio cholerae M66-2]ACP11863.1 conserved hypothetical protein [Vibrio cholerae O395]AEA80384.1 hypothetical protein VCLMA_B0763 [Vibrio cholerae LMA3984-4]AET29115.1 conserved hypothetical protein [Vibrio cholerae O1 str. 2010EL-1786]APF51385.1 hypothetical protein ASZ80_03893 [Vibrio cholerae]EEO05524.1 hypothetical protein VIF_003093 [Vibrio cholerae TM 11079-80]EET24
MSFFGQAIAWPFLLQNFERHEQPQRLVFSLLPRMIQPTF